MPPGATIPAVGSACRTPRRTRGSGCGTAASTRWCGRTSATSARSSSCARRCPRQGPDGFVPHLRYGDGPYPHEVLWGRRASSTITQPPMYGHAVAELTRLGMPPADEVVAKAQLGLEFLLRSRQRTPGGLVELCHPWESGCDDSPRWDDTVPGGRTPASWFDRKGELVAIDRADAERRADPQPGVRGRLGGLQRAGGVEHARAGDHHRRRRPRGAMPESWPVPSTSAGTPSG